MLYTQMIYNLLGIPDSVDEPTAYDLLALAPFGLSTESINEALLKQKKRVFMEIPDPAYIPTVLRLSRDLDRAASLLLDEDKRAKHDEYISSQLANMHNPSQAKRSQAMIEARKGLATLVNRDLVLPDEVRPKIEDKLKGLGLDDKEVRRLLNMVPKPAPFIPNLRNQVVQYYVDLINFSVQSGEFASDKAKIREIGAQKLQLPGTSADQILQQADQGPVTSQALEMALEVNGGYFLESAVDQPDTSSYASSSDETGTFAAMMEPVNYEQGSGVGSGVGMGSSVQSDTIDIRPRRKKAGMKSIGGLIIAAVILVGFGIFAIVVLNMSRTQPGDSGNGPTQPIVGLDQYNTRERSLAPQVERLNNVNSDSRFISNAITQMREDFLDAQDLSSRNEYTQAMQKLDSVETAIGRIDQMVRSKGELDNVMSRIQNARAIAIDRHADDFAPGEFKQGNTSFQLMMTEMNNGNYEDAHKYALQAEENYTEMHRRINEATAP